MGEKIKDKRIVVIASYAGSLVNFRGPLLQTLRDHGLEVHVAAPELSADIEITRLLESWSIKTHDIPLKRTGLNPLLDIYSLFSIYRLLRRVKPTIVLAYTIKPVVYGLLAAWFARVPMRVALITGLGYMFTEETTNKRTFLHTIVRRLYAVALGCATKVFFQNPDDQALFRDTGLIPDAVPSLVVNGSGVDVAHFNVTPLPPGGPQFLLIARLLGAKGVREYASCAANIRKIHPEVLFRLVGDLDDNPDSITKEELGYWVDQNIVEYLGSLNDVRSAISDSNVFVLPTYYREGTPRTILEAMSMGRPIITTDAPGCRETVLKDRNGYLVRTQAADDLFKAMMRFVEQPQLISAMGKCSRKIAEDKYDVHKVNAVMLKEMDIQ